MPQDPRKIIRQLSDNILTLDPGNYLVSEQFSLFCREHDINDIWRADLELSRNRPDLYGGDIAKNAFLLVLQHIYNGKKNEFPGIIADLLTDFSGRYQHPSFFSEIKENLTRLSYSRQYVEDAFSKTGKKQQPPTSEGDHL